MSKKRDRENAEAMGVAEVKQPAKGKRALPTGADLGQQIAETPEGGDPFVPGPEEQQATMTAESGASGEAEPTKAETFGIIASAAIVYEEVEYARLFASPLNPRRQRHPETIPDLARSIAEKGLLQPLLCRPHPNMREIAVGSRRHEAIGYAIEQGWLPPDYKVAIRTRPMTNDELVIIAGVENFDREDMDALDEAELFAAIRERVVPIPGQRKEAAIGALFHIDERTVFRRLDLLKLSDEAKAELRAGRLTLGDAYVLADQTAEVQDELIEEARAALPRQVEPQVEAEPDPAIKQPLPLDLPPQHREAASETRPRNETPAPAAKAPQPKLAIRKPRITNGVYDLDDNLLGSVKSVERWLAQTPDGKEVGIFESRVAAQAALQRPAKPRADAECIAEAQKVLGAYDQAFRLGKSTDPFRERMGAILREMNDGLVVGNGEQRLRTALARNDGGELLWGQPGRFEITAVDDNHEIRIGITTQGLFQTGMEFAFTAEAVEDGVFLTSTGQREYLNLARPGVPKMGVSAWVSAEITRWRGQDEFGKKLKKPRGFVKLKDGWRKSEIAADDERAEIEAHVLKVFTERPSAPIDDLAIDSGYTRNEVHEATMRLLARGDVLPSGDGYRLANKAEPQPEMTE